MGCKNVVFSPLDAWHSVLSPKGPLRWLVDGERDDWHVRSRAEEITLIRSLLSMEDCQHECNEADALDSQEALARIDRIEQEAIAARQRKRVSLEAVCHNVVAARLRIAAQGATVKPAEVEWCLRQSLGDRMEEVEICFQAAERDPSLLREWRFPLDDLERAEDALRVALPRVAVEGMPWSTVMALRSSSFASDDEVSESLNRIRDPVRFRLKPFQWAGLECAK